MKKSYQTIFILFIINFLFSCNEITAEDYLLTDANSNYLEVKYKYWHSKQLSEGSEKFIELQDFDSVTERKLWRLGFYPNSNQYNQIKLRAIKLKKKRMLFQIALTEKGKTEVMFLHGELPNDSTLYIFNYTSESFYQAKSNSLLKKIDDNVIFNNKEIKFDSIAISKHPKTILKFLKNNMNKSYNFEKDTIIFNGYHHPKLN